MNTKQLLLKFNQGINWNAILSISHKILSVILSYSLYYACTVSDYNLWANTHSIIFLMLLWIDGGLRKSIPRFAPLFSAEGVTQSFLWYLTLFQATALILAMPLIIVGASRLTASLGIIYYILPQILILFILEGIISTIRLIYYSYFWHKSFNQKYLLIFTIEILLSCAAILYGITPLIPAIFIIKIISCLVLIMVTARDIPSIIYDAAHDDGAPGIASRGGHNLVEPFITHTGAMWASNAIKSLSERNVMLLLFTYIFGPQQANLFKVANDGAVVIYRTLIKTIGTTDTSLLAHSFVFVGENGMQKAFKKLSAKVTALCLPLLGLIAGIYTVVSYYKYDHSVFHIIFILIISYVLEVTFSSYERVLEVNFRYRYLVYAYVPYLILLLSPLLITSTLSRIACIGLVPLLICIHSVRLVSTFLMVCFARTLYNLEWPVSLRMCITRLLVSYVCGIPIGIVLIGIVLICVPYVGGWIWPTS